MHRNLLLAALLLLSASAVPFAVSAAAPTAGTVFTEPTLHLDFIRIPGGRFLMGDSAHRGYAFEKPLHPVTVKEFFIGRHEVTFAAYDAFAKATGRPLPDDAGWGRGSRPVINVSWDDARAFAAWLSEKSRRTFRLPTEAEWEYAARAGTDSGYWWGNAIGSGNANCNGCGSRWDNLSTAPVGSFAPNSFGLYDMLGNVYEWVEDSGHDSYQGAPGDGSAWVDDQAATRVLRSSSFRDQPDDLRSSIRNWVAPQRKQNDAGFRLAMENAPPTPPKTKPATATKPTTATKPAANATKK